MIAVKGQLMEVAQVVKTAKHETKKLLVLGGASSSSKAPPPPPKPSDLGKGPSGGSRSLGKGKMDQVGKCLW